MSFVSFKNTSTSHTNITLYNKYTGTREKYIWLLYSSKGYRKVWIEWELYFFNVFLLHYFYLELPLCFFFHVYPKGYTSQLLSILRVSSPIIIIIWMKGSYVLTLYDCVIIITKIIKEKCEKINFVNKLSFILFGICPAVVQYCVFTHFTV